MHIYSRFRIPLAPTMSRNQVVSQENFARPALGHAMMGDLGQHKSAHSLYSEWKGVGDQTSKTRAYKGGADNYYQRGPMYCLFERETNNHVGAKPR